MLLKATTSFLLVAVVFSCSNDLNKSKIDDMRTHSTAEQADDTVGDASPSRNSPPAAEAEKGPKDSDGTGAIPNDKTKAIPPTLAERFQANFSILVKAAQSIVSDRLADDGNDQRILEAAFAVLEFELKNLTAPNRGDVIAGEIIAQIAKYSELDTDDLAAVKQNLATIITSISENLKKDQLTLPKTAGIIALIAKSMSPLCVEDIENIFDPVSILQKAQESGN